MHGGRTSVQYFRANFKAMSLSSAALLHSTPRAQLHAAVTAFTRALSAWRLVSSTGAGHAVRLANGVVTLCEAAAFGQSDAVAAPGAYGAAADDARAALDWLVAAVGRLKRALEGLDVHVAGVRKKSWRAGVGCEWGDVYERGVNALKRDFEDKEGFLRVFEGVVAGTIECERGMLQMGAETWLEMPRMDEGEVDFLAAAYEAQVCAEEILEERRLDERRRDREVESGEGNSDGGKSPAMKLLLGAGGGSGSKKGKKKRK